MTDADLLALADRVEKLAGPDRETDHDIEVAVNGGQKGRSLSFESLIPTVTRNHRRVEVPRYTASLDAAMTLVPKDHGWLVGNGRTRPDEPLGGAQIYSLDGKELVAESEAATPAIALTAACLRALTRFREAQAGGEA